MSATVQCCVDGLCGGSAADTLENENGHNGLFSFFLSSTVMHGYQLVGR